MSDTYGDMDASEIANSAYREMLQSDRKESKRIGAETIDLQVGKLTIKQDGIGDPVVTMDGEPIDFEKGRAINAITVKFKYGWATTMDLEYNVQGERPIDNE